jgi:S1-C subfamily serine protease
MKHCIRATIAMVALAIAAAPALAKEDEASVDERLADAQRRLEDAAREVAELSGEAAADAGFQQFEYFLPRARRAMLGVNLGGAEPNGGGVRVESVSPGGPAQAAGVKPGDVIVAIQAKPVTTGRELVRAMEEVEPGQKVDLGLKRDGKPLKLAVEAREMDRDFFVGTPPLPAIRALRALPALEALPLEGYAHWLLEDWGDAELVSLTPGLGRYFGTEKGVLVARAPEDAALGLQDGDVILSIGGREPQSGSHAMRILRSYQPGESVELRILRDRRAQTLSAKIPEHAQPDLPRRRPPPPPRAAPVPPPPPGPAAAT